jgi:hypothetical protein
VSTALLELAAATLGDVVDDVVFVGGATIHLWQSEPGAPPTRATEDVDVVCEAATRGRYEALASRLRKRGFGESPHERVICRWRHRESGLALDLMPDDARVFGFTNRWYTMVLETAVAHRLPSGARIRAAAPPVLLATKLAAWGDRGGGDILGSLDVHDVVVLADGRPQLIDEVRAASPELAAYVREALAGCARIRISTTWSRVHCTAMGAWRSTVHASCESGSTRSHACRISAAPTESAEAYDGLRDAPPDALETDQ